MKTISKNQIGETGLFGENIASEYLESIGYEILARNSIHEGKEIDIIAQDLKYILFVEVKTRRYYKHISRYGSPSKAVNNEKQQHIISAAKAYLKMHRPKKIPRFDVIEVYVDRTENGLKTYKINHIPRAFGTW